MKTILELKFGSHLYGTDTPNSDLDLKAIYLPAAREIILHSYKETIQKTRPKQVNERNTKDDVDIEILSLDRYVSLLLQGQTMALDILFAPRKLWTQWTSEGESIMDHLYENRLELVNKNVNAFVGYAKQQAAKYGQKGFRIHALRATMEFLESLPQHTKLKEHEELINRWLLYLDNKYIKIVQVLGRNGISEPHLDVCDKKVPLHATVKFAYQNAKKRFEEYGARALMAEKNEGVDFKALSHAVRVNSEAIELLQTNHITFPRPDRELLLKIKLGQMPYKEVAELIEQGLQDLYAAQQLSSLRDAPNYEWAHQFIFETYHNLITAK